MRWTWGRDREEQRRELGRWREEIARVYDGVPEHPAAERLQQAIRTFPSRAALSEIIAGVEMDLEKATYETFDELYPYCYRVASAVGLCCIEIFGYADVRAREYAVNLGIALQLPKHPPRRAGRRAVGPHLRAAGGPGPFRRDGSTWRRAGTRRGSSS